MNLRHVSIAVAAALALSTSAIAATPHSHAGHASAPAKLALDHGRKWATDEPLRQGMNEIRALVAAKLEAIHTGKMSAGDYTALGAAVEQKVGTIVATCKLPPEADAMLHLIVADMLAGTEAMQGKSKDKPLAGAHKVVTAANNYGRYFDHPGWKPLG
jgi:hypothetical protein